MNQNKKFIFITGGVISSIGKGLTSASIGTLMEASGVKVNLIKCDPYINVDPGTMSPFQHGEVFVTEDGAETDLDLGHYERFTSLSLKKENSLTAGQIYEKVISKERKGKYLGRTVQVIPHITDEIKNHLLKASKSYDLTLVEIGGTIGDIESLPFIEAIGQMRIDLGMKNTFFIHLTYIPFFQTTEELKSKPTQHSVRVLRQAGIHPDVLICRLEKKLPLNLKRKIALFCNLHEDHVFSAQTQKTIYDIPLKFKDQKLDSLILSHLGIKKTKKKYIDLNAWKKMNESFKKASGKVHIGFVGKYVDLKESYKSLNEAFHHGGASLNTEVVLHYIDSEKLNARNIKKTLSSMQAVLIPGGFGERAIEGKLLAIEYVRKNKIPFLGICLGMQLAVIEFARNVCGLKRATSREFSKNKKADFVIDLMESQKKLISKGANMRLGDWSCVLKKGSLSWKIYQKNKIEERHRHRYEFNNKYLKLLEKKGLVFSGFHKNKKTSIVEIIENPNHPFFIGVQFHPEFKSKPLKAHPLFLAFIKQARKKKAKKSLKK